MKARRTLIVIVCILLVLPLRGWAQRAASDTLSASEMVLPAPLDAPIDPSAYILGPYDQLLLVLQAGESKQFKMEVLPGGKTVLPNVGPFPAAGMTLAAFQTRVRQALSRFYPGARIDCLLARPRRFVVYVLGEVQRPGPVVLYPPFKVADAITGAGGFTERAGLREIEIRERGRLVRKVDHFRFLQLGEVEENPVLREGQSVYVPPLTARATVLGRVKRPGRYQIKSGETAADLVALAGGLAPGADTERVILEHVEGGEVRTGTITCEDLAQGTLEDRDVLVVPDAASFTRIAKVRVRGGGARQGVYYIEKGEKLSDFVFRMVQLNAESDLAHTVLERNGDNDKRSYLTVDLTRLAREGATGGIPLRDGDIITIPKIEENVYVVGEVENPGPITFIPDLPAEKYIGLAGGPTSDGGIDHIVILDREGNARKGGRKSEVFRGETIVVKRKTSAVLGSAFVGLASLTGLLISIIAISK